MKREFVIPTLILGLFITLLSFSSCKDDDPDTKAGSLAFHIHTLIDATEVESYGDTLLRNDGRAITVETAQLYLSNIKLIKTDGSVVDGPSTIVLVKQGTEEYEIGDIPTGNYKTVRFDVGLPGAINTTTPSTSDQVLYQPAMWFGPSVQPDGFVFVNFQGTIDTSAAPYGGNLIPFAFKIGTNEHRVTVTMPDLPFTVLPEQQTVVHLEANYAKILDGVQLNVIGNLNLTTAEQNAWSWVSDMTSNIADMFEYE